MKLYFSRGACALGPQIILREAGFNFEHIPVNLKEKTFAGGNFLEVNPKGYVPVLQLDNGAILTEGAIILQYIADQAPDKKLIPAFGTFERYKHMEMLHYLATEVHKGFGAIFAAVFAGQPAPEPALVNLKNKIQYLENVLKSSDYLLGSEFSVSDAYAFNLLSWTTFLKFDLSPFPHVMKYMDNLRHRPSVMASLKAEGLI